MRLPLSPRLATLTALVLLGHLALVDQLPLAQLGEGAADARPVRMAVAFVRQLAPSAVPAAPAAPAAAPAPRPRSMPSTAPSDATVAEAPLPAASAPEALPEPTPALPALPAPPLLVPESRQPAALVAAPAAPAASAPASFEWPPSTRLSYRLSGNYRGPVDGRAQVEWLRSGGRYQVFMDLSIGPSFAPLMSRRVSSEGQISPQGLVPQRYDEETKLVLMSPRRLQVEMDASTVRLANGKTVPRPAGLQDSASQFVHLTWLFTTQPELLQTGRSIVLPLALPRTLEPWTYDVVGSETLNTPAGPVLTVHVKPRREAKAGGDMTAEIWVAPTLQYLPVRILIRQDNDTYIDLTVDRLPEQALPGR